MNARKTALVTALALAFVALGDATLAQQAAGARSQSGNSVQRSAGGGASSAANRGGAGGVSDAEPGVSAGPQGARRSGYLGGRDSADDGDAGGTVVIAAPTAGEPGVSCHEAHPGGLSPTARLSGPNMGRINQVRALLNTAGWSRHASSRYLLANFQEELAKTAPDLELAATYLGIAASAPLNPQLVLRASELLCVPLTLEQASSLSTIAEAERLRLETDFR